MAYDWSYSTSAPDPSAAGAHPSPQASGATTAAGVVSILVSALLGLVALLLLLLSFSADDWNTEGALSDVSTGVLTAASFLWVAWAVWGVVAATALLRRKDWGRLGTIVGASVGAGVALLFTFTALADTSGEGDATSDGSDGSSSAGEAVWWLLPAAACATVVVLTSRRQVADDIRRHAAHGAANPVGYAGYSGQTGHPGYGAPPAGQGQQPPTWRG